MSLEMITHTDRKSPISEAYRTLRTNIQFSNVDRQMQTILVTSSAMSEGKTTTITNLAETFAQAGQRVLLIDADLRRPRVHKVFGASNQQGLTNVLALQVSLQDAVQIVGSDIHMLSSGPLPPNPAELLGSNQMKQVMSLAKQQYDVILLDTPPVNVVTDAAVLSTEVDGVVLVVASGKTEIDGAKRAVKLLQAVNANIIGTVMTMMPVMKKGYYGYKYYSYQEDAPKKRKKRFSK